MENPMFHFIPVPPLAQGPTFSMKEQFSFPLGFQGRGPKVCDMLPLHSHPRPIFPAAFHTLIVPLEALARHLEACLACTIQLGYVIQYVRRPPKFSCVLETSVAAWNAPVLREEITVLLAKDAIEPVPAAEMRQGFYSPYFIVPKTGGGLQPILDLRVLNWALHRFPFKMLMHRRMIKCIQPQDWFAAIDLKDAYFYVSILPQHKPFLRFAFEGQVKSPLFI